MHRIMAMCASTVMRMAAVVMAAIMSFSAMQTVV